MTSALEQPILASHQTFQDLTAYLLGRVPGFKVPDPANWATESQHLRQEVLERVVFRGVPESWRTGPVNLVWGDVLEVDAAYRIRKLRYEALPGFWIPAALYEPTVLAEKAPIVLNVNGHVGPAGKAIDYKQIRCANLARRGMIALNPEWLFFGELQGDGYHHNRAAYLDLCGVAGVSVFFLAMQRGLDVLLGHPNGDPDRLAVTGLSGGGWQTIILSSLDTRVKLAAPNAGYIGLDVRIKNREDIGDIEQNPTDLVSIADYPMLTALLAPRPALLLYNHKDDCCFQTHRAKPSVYDPVRPLYEALGHGDSFEFHDNLEPGTHNYDLDNRQQFYRFINRHFLPSDQRIDTEIASSTDVRTEAELTAGLPDENANFFTLSADLSAALPRSSWPYGPPATVREWQSDAKSRLRDVLRYRRLSVSETQSSDETRLEGVTVTRSVLKIGQSWHIPVVTLSASGATNGVSVLTADEGRGTLAEGIDARLNEGRHVVVADLLFQGECGAAPIPDHQWAMMASTSGDRLLGIQTAQLAAVAEWAGRGTSVELVGVGTVSSVVTLAAASLTDAAISKVAVHDSLSSLKQLFAEEVLFELASSLFCFGLLEAFDIRELIGLLAPTPVSVSLRPGDPGDTLLRLRELYARYGEMGFHVR